LAVGLGIYPIAYEYLAISNYPDESVEHGKSLCDIFWRFRHAVCTFPISMLSVGVLISVVGQLDGSCESHCGPFHHSVDVDRVVGSNLLEMRSAGLD